ncbi:UNKNOWN [Stylonychia lemnae]|uniref:Uncharacterized protein n=1 Tax=Stylonychia lemnae TaxID=5949 RepID=A0A078A4H4_STYLE|nr:UNKNOWN [Stylonychia lemnae]|eukprot:CDW75664.1 UNKNOWN [Stylonychia lemnae]
MGCQNTKDDKKSMNVLQRWNTLKFQEPAEGVFENDFELLLFKTMNLIRQDPQWAIPFIKNVRQHKHYTGANIDLVIQILKKQKPLPLLEISQHATNVCRKVNEDMKNSSMPVYYTLKKQYQRMYVKDNESSLSGSIIPSPNSKHHSKSIAFSELSPTFGSPQKKERLLLSQLNITEVNFMPMSTEIVNMTTEATTNLNQTINRLEEPVYEYTEIGWEGSADELVLFILIGGCQCSGGDEPFPLIDEKVTRIGLSFKGHKSLKSSLQLLYLEGPSQFSGNPYSQHLIQSKAGYQPATISNNV